ncbi:MAG: DMT family transporter [Beijerinckiaceae bacterium]|nr:DMT family transporter [Beijerinckiaceae bacterium]
MATIDPPAGASRQTPSMSSSDWALLVLLSMLWGGSYLFNALALRELPVFTVVAFRVLVGGLALHLALRVMRIPFPLDRASLKAYFGMAILNCALPFCLIVFGQTRVPSGLASILNATTPIFTMVLAHLFLASERLDPRRAAGVMIGFAGVVVLFWDRLGAGAGELIGLLACLGASLSYGFSNIFGRKVIVPGAHPLAMAAGQQTFAFLPLMPLALMVDAPFSGPAPSLTAIGAIVGLGLLSTAVAYSLFYRILARAGATNVSLVTLLIPCSAILFGTLFLGERLEEEAFLGLAIIAAGLLVIDGRLIGLFRRRRD